ncbi:hypothetical protein MVLG_06646 [Microbotryum lychnidis-dioicae p1A1 Lamole]|uniref:Uncharacterized protein n=1 Tax=Microbotryum lychnidis-dioicae (strain p1A1 Lamole / MvSl-1064) TaxID=683840 RepID=U5HHX6_USTV1|nr:hypothetical protein MVLG_06646 [Microbotryum lychnidis-dioicae p1A1 Lamole]|eukprot:KDE02822.1 hypothetical protein MVLG_06646 [Microbotryum lychnidis-dioicae p1A1 Lamole]
MGKPPTNRPNSQLHPLLPLTREQHHRMLTVDVEATRDNNRHHSNNTRSRSTSPSSPVMSITSHSPSSPYTIGSSPRSSSIPSPKEPFGAPPRWSERLSSLPRPSSIVSKSKEIIHRPWRLPRWRSGPFALLCLLFLGTFASYATYHLSNPDQFDLGYRSNAEEDHWFKDASSVDLTEEETRDGEYIKPSLKKLKQAVGDEPHFLAKDGIAWYGFNNRRYMLEATMNLARVSHRIPILPSHIWARSCVVDSADCTKHALQHLADRKNAPGFKDEFTWNEDGEAWRLGIEHFIDLPHLRRTYGLFLTQTEYFSLYASSLPPKFKIDLRGYWNPILYNPKGMTTRVLNGTKEFHDKSWVRMDREFMGVGGASFKGSKSWERKGRKGLEGVDENVVRDLMKEDRTYVWSLEKAIKAMRRRGIGEGKHVAKEEWGRALVRQAGLRELYTFDDSTLMCKTMARPSTEYADPLHLRPFQIEAFENYSNATILAISGQIHDQRKPGATHFSTPYARDQFRNWVIEGIRPPRVYILAAEKIVQEMKRRTKGRLWRSAHLRRGDFVGIAWAPEKDPVRHFGKLKNALGAGIQVLRQRRTKKPGRGALQPLKQEELPFPNDPFYLATDETDPKALAYYRRQGAVLLHEVMGQDELEDVLGWRAKYWDLLALVEQEVLAQSDYFVGSRMSSTTGGALNSRLRRRREKEGREGEGEVFVDARDDNWIFLEEFNEREREDHD